MVHEMWKGSFSDAIVCTIVHIVSHDGLFDCFNQLNLIHSDLNQLKWNQHIKSTKSTY